MIQEIETLRRKAKKGYLFYSSDRKYKSEYFTSAEERDEAMFKYIGEQLAKEEEYNNYLKQQKKIYEQL